LYRREGLESIEVARRAAEIASDKQASDIVLLDIRGLCDFAQFFVICSADTERQMSTVLYEVEQQLGKDGISPLHREGASDSGWVLLDYGDVIVHVFSSEAREYYRLERLWSGAVPVLRIQ